MLGRRMGPGGRAPTMMDERIEGAIDPRDDDESLSRLAVDARRSSIADVGGMNTSSRSPESRRLLRPESLLLPETLLVAESPRSLRGKLERRGRISRFSSSSFASAAVLGVVANVARAGVRTISGEEGCLIIGGCTGRGRFLETSGDGGRSGCFRIIGDGRLTTLGDDVRDGAKSCESLFATSGDGFRDVRTG